MENKNRYKVTGILKKEDGENLILEYVPEPGEPKHDDLPSEQLNVGDHYYLTFTPVKKEPEDDFNKT